MKIFGLGQFWLDLFVKKHLGKDLKKASYS